MIQEWNKVEFEFGTNPKNQYDLVVTEFGNRNLILDVLKDRPAAKQAAVDAIKKIKKDEDGKALPKTFSIPYEGKGGLAAFTLVGNPGAYLLQDALRKVFCATLSVSAEEEGEESEKAVNVHLRGVKDNTAEQFLEWIAALGYIVRYRPEVYGKKEKEQKALGTLVLYIDTSLNKKIAMAAIQKGRVMGICNNQVKYLADLPSNYLNPKTYRAKAEKLAEKLREDSNVKVEFLDQKALRKKNAGAFLAVVDADHHERAGIVHLSYSPKGKKAKKKIALVGKGICFDTGGYNVKTGEHMYNMHRDMTGSAVALSLFRAFVELESEFEVHAYLALAENLISHAGYRPNDIVTASNGMSIEVIDTDAEGRMVLSDTLAIASEEKPDFIIDFATLTGSVVRALDTRRCGAYSNENKLSQLAVEVGERCGERVWNFPIGQDYNESLESPYADIRQCSSSGSADHIYAATFLSKFVGKNIPWIHIDLAADTNKGGLGLVPTETTGFGVRFGYELIQSFFNT